MVAAPQDRLDDLDAVSTGDTLDRHGDLDVIVTGDEHNGRRGGGIVVFGVAIVVVVFARATGRLWFGGN